MLFIAFLLGMGTGGGLVLLGVYTGKKARGQ